MVEKADPSLMHDFYEQTYCDRSREVRSELYDVTLTNQQVITKAVERVVDQANVLIAMICDLGEDEDSSEWKRWRMGQKPFSEFLKALPCILNGVALDLFSAQSTLNDAIYLQDRERPSPNHETVDDDTDPSVSLLTPNPQPPEKPSEGRG